MHLHCTATALALLQTVAAHTVFTTLFVNDVDQGDGTCIRMPRTPDNATFPINDLASNSMACGFGGTMGVARVCPISQGAKLTFQWREWADGSQPGSIDISHKGPCAVYMKAVSSAIEDSAYGSGWFKIWDYGYDATTKQWCTETLIENNGLLSVNVPIDIAGGSYLVRPELLSLHEADKTPPNPQFYTGCAQVFLETDGAAVPTNTVSIPGYVHTGDKSVVFNIYELEFPYPMPGPAPYASSTVEKGNVKVASASVKIQTQTEGLVPANCVLVNANWAGIELDSYSAEDGCWNASSNCWDQTTNCYNEAPPTGSKNCRIWEDKCTAIQEACEAHSFNGPPNKGKDLNPPINSPTSIPAAMPATGGVYSTVSRTLSLSNTAVDAGTSVHKSPTKSTQSPSHLSLATSTKLKTTSSDDHSSLDGVDKVSQTSAIALHPVPGLSSTGLVSYVTNTFKASTTADSSPKFTGVTNTFKAHTPTTSSSKAIGTLSVSRNGSCGPNLQTTCKGSIFGVCCSQYGWCGYGPSYCSGGCQVGFGTCGYEFGKMKHRKMAKHRHMAHRLHD